MYKQGSTAAAALLALVTGAQAATLEVTSGADLDNLELGQSFDVQLATSEDFPNILGGTFDVSYDADVLSYAGAEFDAIFDSNDDQLEQAAGASGLTTIDGVLFNSLFFQTGGGAYPVGELMFDVVGEGMSDIDLATSQAGGFEIVGEPGSVADVTFGSMTATVPGAGEGGGPPVAPIPLPASGLLLGAAVASIGGRRALARR